LALQCRGYIPSDKSHAKSMPFLSKLFVGIVDRTSGNWDLLTAQKLTKNFP